MKKKFLPIFLSVLMPFSAFLTACGGNVSESSQKGDSEYSELSDTSSDNSFEDTSNTSNESVSGSESGSESSSDTSNESDNSTDNDSDASNKGENDTIARPDGYPTLCGSFMQPGAFKGYSAKQMESHLQTMYDVGIDILILQWSFTTEDGKVTDAYFDSDFGDNRADIFDASGAALVENILSAAEKVGVKVFIGLNDSSEWWQMGVLDRNWIDTQANLGLNGAKQLHDKYAAKYPNAFYGWYFVFEFYNMVAPDAVINNASYLLNLYRDGLYEIAPSMPMMLSPYISEAGADPKETGVLWQKVFAGTNFKNGDIYCCQDSVGAGHISIDRLDAYYAEIKKAVDTKDGLLFWANNEDFTLSTSSTAPLDRFIEQLNITDKYVSAHVTFAYSHYQHPDMQKFGEHEAYKYYYENGMIPESTLTKPEAEFTSEPNGNVIIVGTLKNPDKTAQGVNVYKNGLLIKQFDLSGDYGKDELEFRFTEMNVGGNGVAEYSVCGVDYFGNEGESLVKTIEYKARNGKNVALGKDYTLLLAPEENYPDETGKTLTDGNEGLEMYFDRAWVGFLGAPSVVIDLGAKTDGIYSLKVNTLGGGSAAVFAPTGIKVYVSDDGSSFKEVKNQEFDPDNGTDSSYSVKRVLTLDEDVSARFVKVEVTTNQSWIFIDEIAVYAE